MKKQFERPSVDNKHVYRCCIHLYAEQDGYCVYAADLAGVVSEGDTVEDAIRNITEAYQGVIESYLAHDEEIPWRTPTVPSNNETARWIEVHA